MLPIACNSAVFLVTSCKISFSIFKLPKPNKIGVPAAPKLTAVEFDINARTTDNKGVNPKLTKSGATIAAGVPKPATPSIKLPNNHAIMIACILASGEIEERNSCM